MRFKGLDLNLLVALDALLNERSVSRAATKLRLTQPAMSNALHRLRLYFRDDLLTAAGRGLTPTPRGLELTEAVRRALTQVDIALSPASSFDPATLERRFRLLATSYPCAVLIAPLSAALAHEAPGVALDLVSSGQSPLISLEQDEIDLALAQETFAVAGHPTEILLRDTYAVMAWSEHPALRTALTLDAFFAYPHVALRLRGGRTETLVERYLPHDRERRIDVTVNSTNEAPLFLIGSERLMLTPRRLALTLAAHYPLKVVAAPFALPDVRWVQQYHRLRGDDAALAWLRRRLLQVAADLDVEHGLSL